MSVAVDDKRRGGAVSEAPSADKTVRPPASRPADARAFAAAVGEVIRRERLLRKWTQALVAEKAGLSPNYVARLERGELAPSLFVARRICEAFAISIDVLAGHAPARPPRERTRRDSMLRRRTTTPPSSEEEE